MCSRARVCVCDVNWCARIREGGGEELGAHVANSRRANSSWNMITALRNGSASHNRSMSGEEIWPHMSTSMGTGA